MVACRETEGTLDSGKDSVGVAFGALILPVSRGGGDVDGHWVAVDVVNRTAGQRIDAVTFRQSRSFPVVLCSCTRACCHRYGGALQGANKGWHC